MYKHLIQPFMCGLLVCGLKLFGKNCQAQIYHVQSVFSGLGDFLYFFFFSMCGNISFGCGNINACKLANSSDMVRLGRGPLSLVSQLGLSRFS
jgi:hypothetical protein